MKLDLSPLENAVAQLGASLVLYDSDIVRQFPIIRNQMRAGAIQAFEFTYELSIRMIKRYLEQVSANPSEVDLLDFRNLDAVPRQSRDHQPYLQRAELQVRFSRKKSVQVELEQPYPCLGTIYSSLFRVLPQHTVALTCAKALELPQNGFLRGNQVWP